METDMLAAKMQTAGEGPREPADVVLIRELQERCDVVRKTLSVKREEVREMEFVESALAAGLERLSDLHNQPQQGPPAEAPTGVRI